MKVWIADVVVSLIYNIIWEFTQVWMSVAVSALSENRRYLVRDKFDIYQKDI